MFNRYIFEDPRDDSRRIYVGAWGYVAAGLAGSFYVLWKVGRPGFDPALVRHLAILVMIVIATAVTSDLPAAQQLVALIAAIPALLTFQSLWMVRIIRKTLEVRGWIVEATV